MDPSADIQDLLENNEKYYNYVINDRPFNPNIISDIYDGKMYRDFVQSLPDDIRNRYVTFICNSDGSLVFNSSKYSVWPIQLMLNELPVNIRKKKQ